MFIEICYKNNVAHYPDMLIYNYYFSMLAILNTCVKKGSTYSRKQKQKIGKVD